MSLDEKVLDRIREDSARWIDERFAPLDVPTPVNLQRQEDGEVSFHDDRFAPLADTGPAGRAALHRFLANPDDEAITSLGFEYERFRLTVCSIDIALLIPTSP